MACCLSCSDPDPLTFAIEELRMGRGYELVSMAGTHVDTQVRNLVKMALGRSTGFSDKSVRLAAFPDCAAVLLYLICLSRR
jgi:hypothetical protein